MPIRLLLIDDHAMFREFAARALSEEPDIYVAAHTDSVEAGLSLLPTSRPDLALLDYNLGGRSGLDFVAAARARGYAGQILLLSAAVPDADLRKALVSGVSGLVLKEDSTRELLAAIRAIAEGRSWLDDRCVQVMASSATESDRFTHRERQILTGVADGLTNKEIATRLELPETTVKSGLQILFRKTGVRTRGGLVKVALEKYRNDLLR
jgi:two-component system, NarL family, nitrate/nitrite response regulator NarL